MAYKGSGEVKNLPQGYLDGGYFKNVNGKEVLKVEYIIDYSRKISNILSDCDATKNKSTQLRKYYDFCIRIKSLLKSNKDKYELVESELKKVIYHVQYANKRGTVTKEFVNFIEKNVNNIKNAEDFYAFITHFESIIAYLKK